MKRSPAVLLRKVLESNLVCFGQLHKTAKGGQARSVDEKQNSMARGTKSCPYVRDRPHPSLVIACCSSQLRCHPNLMVRAWPPGCGGALRVWNPQGVEPSGCGAEWNQAWSLSAGFRRHGGRVFYFISLLLVRPGLYCSTSPLPWCSAPLQAPKQPGRFPGQRNIETK